MGASNRKGSYVSELHWSCKSSAEAADKCLFWEENAFLVSRGLNPLLTCVVEPGQAIGIGVHLSNFFGGAEKATFVNSERSFAPL